MQAVAIIGANFGDEGKGLMTDHLASPESLVVRFNGGAQAGHTVVRGGTRHVFHHFGSGSLKGAATFLSRYFIVNPLLCEKEVAELRNFPKVFVDRDCPITTPWDMIVNQELNRKTGHGSCGIGINETVTREDAGFMLRAADLWNPDLRSKVLQIRSEYCAVRMAALGLPVHPWFRSQELLEHFLSSSADFLRSVIVCDARKIGKFQSVVFEGAQGLLLDERSPFFPHVTRGRTGLANVISLCSEAGIDSLDVVYVTRSYMTRHGNGPFPSEVRGLKYADETNVFNEFQGLLRFGNLDMDLMTSAIQGDLRETGRIELRPVLAMTHLDQIGNTKFAEYVADRCGIPLGFISSGPTSEAVCSMEMTSHA